jgi:hypothetical protein
VHQSRWLRSHARFGLAAVACSVAVGSLATIGPTVTAAAVPSNTSSTQTTSVLNVTVDSKGWYHYNSVLAPTLGLSDEVTTTISGKADAGGSCSFSSPLARATAAAGYAEETAFNPTTCQETVTSGTPSAAGEARLAAAQPASGTGPVNAVSTSPLKQTSTSGTVTAATTYPGAQAFEKVSYVDPLDITITSLTTNLNWHWYNASQIQEANGTAVPYDFQYDGWSNSGVSFQWYGYPGTPSYTELGSAETFKNNDWEALVIYLLGPAGWAACGGTIKTATFYLNPLVKGVPGGYYYVGYNNSVSGGCSDLVHFRENHGTGSSS